MQVPGLFQVFEVGGGLPVTRHNFYYMAESENDMAVNTGKMYK